MHSPERQPIRRPADAAPRREPEWVRRARDGRLPARVQFPAQLDPNRGAR